MTAPTLTGRALTATPDAPVVTSIPFQNLGFTGLDNAATYTLTVTITAPGVTSFLAAAGTSYSDASIADLQQIAITDTGANVTADLDGLEFGITEPWELQSSTALSFAMTSPSSGSLGTEIVACFAAGTRILTARGEVAVEALRVGDQVAALHRGGFAPLRWIGQRKVATRRHPRPWDVQPVRIAAHAFGPGRPCRDLRVSPDHAVHADGALFRARDLLNGATIVQDDVAEITYFHIELDTHDVVLADGLPAESYLDTGNRGAFGNGGATLLAHPEFARGVWDTTACAPLVWHGPALRALRCRLLEQAGRLGWQLTDNAAPLLLAGGRALLPERKGDDFVFALPAGTASVTLQSRTSVPAYVLPAGDDTRQLGLAVTALFLDGEQVALDDERLGNGWHASENAGLRWTGAAASIDVTGARELAIRATPLLQYWCAPPQTAAALAA
jgi:Hint domain